MKSNTVNSNSSAWKVALEDAIVVGLISLISGLIAGGFPIRAEIVYLSVLNGALTGLYGWARAREIQHEAKK